MVQSFSSHLDPLTNIKTIKEYEMENEQLKNENFELKYQLSYYRNSGGADMQLVNREDFESLKRENVQLREQINAMVVENNKRVKTDGEKDRELLDHKNRERDYIARENEYRNVISSYKNMEADFMEKEKKYSKMISDLSATENNLCDQVKESNNLIEQLKIQNKANEEKNSYLEKKLKDTMCVLEALREDNNDNITNITKMNEQKKFYDNIVNEQAERIKNLEENNNFLGNEVKNTGTASKLREEENKRLINENKQLKSLLEDERRRTNDNLKEIEESKRRSEQSNRMQVENINEKAQQLVLDNRRLSSNLSEFESKLEHTRNEYEKILRKYNTLKNEHGAVINKHREEQSSIDGYRREITKLNNSIFNQRMFLNKMNEFLDHVRLQIKNIGGKVAKFQLNDRNKTVLGKLNIRCNIGINNLLKKLFKVIHDLRHKNSTLENEVSDISSFVKENRANNRTIKLIEEFSKEFEDARNGLNECRAYLERKGKENKLLKNELRKLRKCHRCVL